MRNNNKPLIYLGIAIAILFALMISFLLTTPKVELEVETTTYTYLSSYGNVNKTIFEKLNEENNYIIIKNLEEYNAMISMLNSLNLKYEDPDNYGEYFYNIKEKENLSDIYFAEYNLVILDIYQSGGCNAFNHDITEIKENENELNVKINYKIESGCSGGLGYLTFANASKKIETVNLIYDKEN